MHFARARAIGAERDKIGYEQSAMTGPTNPDHNKAAIQYLIWALEEIEKGGNQKAAEHARRSLDALRKAGRPANLKERSQ